jgi:hypothetical protein
MNESDSSKLELQADRLDYFCPIRLMELLNLPQPLSTLPFGVARRALILNLRNKGHLPLLDEPIPLGCEWVVAHYKNLRQLALASCAYVAAPRLRRSIDVQVVGPWHNILGKSLYTQMIRRKDWEMINSSEPPALTLDKEASTYAMTRWGASYLLTLLPANRNDLIARLNLRLPLSLQDSLPPLSSAQILALDVWIQEQHKLINADN